MESAPEQRKTPNCSKNKGKHQIAARVKFDHIINNPLTFFLGNSENNLIGVLIAIGQQRIMGYQILRNMHTTNKGKEVRTSVAEITSEEI